MRIDLFDMVEVRFACIPGVPGVKCTLDGAVKYSDELGLCSFFGVSQGAHTYSIVAPVGWVFVWGDDVFKRPLGKSGTTVIEWLPYPQIPWPEDQPWMLKFVFEAGEAPPEAPVVSELLGKAGSLLAALSFVGILVDSARKS